MLHFLKVCGCELDGITTHSTRRLGSIPFIVVLFPYLECSMLGAG
jgi:hypothetical protein